MEIDELVPGQTLAQYFDQVVPACSHENGFSPVVKITRNSALMYFMVCQDCGQTDPAQRGAVSHSKIAKMYAVDNLPNKQATDAMGEKYRQFRAGQKADLFARYQQYLDSPKWAELRQQIIQRDEVCQHCSGPIDCVHHVTYERLFSELPEDLVGLCHHCHELVHSIGEPTQ